MPTGIAGRSSYTPKRLSYQQRPSWRLWVCHLHIVAVKPVNGPSYQLGFYLPDCPLKESSDTGSTTVRRLDPLQVGDGYIGRSFPCSSQPCQHSTDGTSITDSDTCISCWRIKLPKRNGFSLKMERRLLAPMFRSGIRQRSPFERH